MRLQALAELRFAAAETLMHESVWFMGQFANSGPVDGELLLWLLQGTDISLQWFRQRRLSSWWAIGAWSQ